MRPLRDRFESARRVVREDPTFRAFLKHTGWLTGSTVMATGLAAVQSILTARMLGVTTWGMLAVALGFCDVVGRLLSFRMNEFVVKWVTHLREDGNDRAATAFKYALAGDAGSSLTAFLIVELLAVWGAAQFAKNPEFAWAFRLLAVTVLLQAGQQTLIGMLQVNRDFRAQGVIQTVVQAASVTAMAVVYFAGGGISWVVAVYLGTAVLRAVLFWISGMRAARAVLEPGWIRAKRAHFDGMGREMMRFAVLGNLRGTLKSIMNDGDLLILGYLRTPTDVAYYKLAKSLAGVAILPSTPLMGAAYPEFTSAVAEHEWGRFRALMRRGSKVAALWMVPVCLGMLVFAKPVIALLYGESFTPAVPVLAVLLIGIVVEGILFWGATALLALGEPGWVAGIGFWATAIKLALAFLLVPMGGAIALAAIQSAVFIGMNAVTTWRCLKTLKTRELAESA